MSEEKDFEEVENIITLTDEEGNDVEFEYLDTVEYEDNEYVLLLPTEEDVNDQVLILQVEDIISENDDEEDANLVIVEDEAVLEAVFEIFKENHKDEFTFED